MTQEDKHLLIKDLSARIPYGVIINTPSSIFYPANREDVKLDSKFYITEDCGWPIEECKPYLRPLSSMIEEEILELYKIAYNTWYGDPLYYKNEEWITFRNSIKNNDLCFKSSVWLSDINKVIDWLNAHHFDYRGLIEKDLAIEVTEENNPYKENDTRR